MLRLIESGVPPRKVLLLTPQRTIAAPYLQLLQQCAPTSSNLVAINTVGSLAKRTISLFWPILAPQAGFAHPEFPPQFLTMETAQYHMSRIVKPAIDGGMFASIKLPVPRVCTQILDSMNKAAVMGFPYAEIATRLQSAWCGDSGRLNAFADLQACANTFRQLSLENNFLDYSLMVEVFERFACGTPLIRTHMLDAYQHFFYDNAEEDTPVVHDIAAQYIGSGVSATIAVDQDAGYRKFLGADQAHAEELRNMCDWQIDFDENFVVGPALRYFGRQMGAALGRRVHKPEVETAVDSQVMLAEGIEVSGDGLHYYPQMVEWVANNWTFDKRK